MPDDGDFYYLNYYDGFHDLNLDKTTMYQSVFRPLAIKLTGCIQRNIILHLELAYLICPTQKFLFPYFLYLFFTV